MHRCRRKASTITQMPNMTNPKAPMTTRVVFSGGLLQPLKNTLLLESEKVAPAAALD